MFLPFIDIPAPGFGATSHPVEVACVLADGSNSCSLIPLEADWRC